MMRSLLYLLGIKKDRRGPGRRSLRDEADARDQKLHAVLADDFVNTVCPVA